jgi:hypothetical protein
MTSEKTIRSAIESATTRLGQPKTVADKLSKWFEEVVAGNESLEDKSDVYKRLATIIDSIVSTTDEGREEEAE